MKKIIILVFLTFFLCTGCYDYKELNELAFISSMGVDLEDDDFIITLEILNEKAKDEDSEKADLVQGKGKTVAEAVQDGMRKIPKYPYFMHLKMLVLEENLTKTKMKDIVDYLLRSSKVSNEFLMVIAKDYSAFEILNYKEKSKTIASDAINQILISDKYINSIGITKTFTEVLGIGLTAGKDIAISTVTIENDKIKLLGISAFKDFNLQDTLSLEDSVIYNILENNAKNSIYKKSCGNNNYTTINVSWDKVKLIVEKDKVNFDLDLAGSISEDNCKVNLNDEKIYLKIENDFKELITDSINKFIRTIKEIDSDLLGISNSYYKKYRHIDEDIWKNLDYKINLDLKINSKGLIYGIEL